MMTASRVVTKFGYYLLVPYATLLAVISSGCTVYRQFVRRVELIDSIAVRLERVEKAQTRQKEEIANLRAATLTQLEKMEMAFNQMDAELIDLGERMEKIGRKVGAWRGELIAENASSETSKVKLDTATAGIDADKLYNTAYLDFTRSNYQVAIIGFRRFIQTFPTSEMADNAQYWLGECFYSLNQLDSAETEFKLVAERYPDGNKVPAALYKLGIIYQLQGKNKKAKEKLTEVVNNYPKSPEAQLAKERLNTIK